MAGTGGMRLVLSLARRELRGAFKGFNVFLTCLALGVAAVAAVGQLNAFVKNSLSADAKTIQGGDISVRRVHLPLDPPDLELLRSLGAGGRIRGHAHHGQGAKTSERCARAD